MQKKEILKALALGAAMAASIQGVNASTIVSVSSDSPAEKVTQASTMIKSMVEAGIPVLASRPECTDRPNQ